MKIRKLIALVLVLCVAASLCVVPGSAVSATDFDTRWNIMLVVDGSGSLLGVNGSDPEGLRYEALSMLVDSLHDAGNYVGVVGFTANKGSNTSFEAMKTGIRWDTGLMPISGIADKDRLKRTISEIHDGDGDTDYGTALLVAQQQLSAMDNGLPNAIFLFTDGEMDLDYEVAKTQAYENLALACENIRNDDIKLFGVYLNCNKSGSKELRNVVYDCMAPGGDLSELYLEINDADDLTNATDTFTRFLGYKMTDERLISEEEYIHIPGVGVEEVNIRIRTLDGENLPGNMNVAITRPDGTVLSDAELNAICSEGRTYQIYKIMNPECGVWSVKVQLPPDSKVDILYRPILSFYVDAGIEVTPASADLHTNDTVTVSAFLEKDGNRLTDPLNYRGYECFLNIINTETGEVFQTIKLESDDNFTTTIPVDFYGQYEAYATFVCDELEVSSPVEVWDLSNNAPTCKSYASYRGKYGLFQENEKHIDLTDSRFGIMDHEDSLAELTYTITGGTCDLNAVSLNGTDIYFDASEIGTGEITITITDTQGESAEMILYVEVENVTLKLILIMIGAFLLLMFIIIMTIRGRNKTRTNGNCSITLMIPISEGGDVKAVACRGLTPPGGPNCARKQNLYNMIKRDLDATLDSSVKKNCSAAGIPFTTYTDTMESIASELRKATVTSVFFKDKKTRKRSSDRIRFKYGNVNQIIRSGDSITQVINGISVTFIYSATGAQADMDDTMGNDGFGMDWAAPAQFAQDPAAWGQTGQDEWNPSESSFSGTSAAPSEDAWGGAPASSASSSNPWDNAAPAEDPWANKAAETPAPVEENAGEWGDSDWNSSPDDDSDPFGF